MRRWLAGRAYALWITFSVALCATLFFPWFLPRETTSGLMGRWLTSGRWWQRSLARRVAPVIDSTVHRWLGVEDCVGISHMERRARIALLYPE